MCVNVRMHVDFCMTSTKISLPKVIQECIFWSSRILFQVAKKDCQMNTVVFAKSYQIISEKVSASVSL
jgi:hypothetical protein